MRIMAEGLVLTLNVGVPIVTWFAAWGITTHAAAEYREAFLALYHLEIVTIEEAETPYEAVRSLEGFEAWWAGIALWLFDPRAACLEGCPQSQRPVT